MSDHNHDEYQQLVNCFGHKYLSLLEKHSISVNPDRGIKYTLKNTPAPIRASNFSIYYPVILMTI